MSAREALVDGPDFLRDLAEVALNRLLDSEITEHLQVDPFECSEARMGYGNGYRAPTLDPRRHPHAGGADGSRRQLRGCVVRALPGQ